ncbi:hypothetical protein HDU67_006768 [Dinochytrium kinnereticum]|nr:hypothetical protein HDU67_006768 [Dinochytrium kinnereticum]
MLAWISLVLGVVDVVLSLWLKQSKAAARGGPVPGVLELSKFEYFLLCFTAVSMLSSVAMTLSTFVNITSKLFYALMGVRNIVMFIAVMIYVDMVLSTNSFQNRFLEKLRTVYLRLLLIPLAITFSVFIYQGYMSDQFHYVDSSKQAEAQFNIITAVGIVTWQLCFVLLLIFVILARRTFSRYLNDVILPEIEKEKTSVGWHSQSGNDSEGLSASRGSGNGYSHGRRKYSSGMPSSGGGSSGKKFKSKSTAIASALRSGITTLRWIGLGLTLFILYSVFFAAAVLYVGTPNVVYFLTLFVNWCTPYFFGFIIFIVVFVRTVGQIRELNENLREDDEGNQLSSSAALPYSLASQGSTVPIENPIQSFYNPSIRGYMSDQSGQPTTVIDSSFKRDRAVSDAVDPELAGFSVGPPIHSPPRQEFFRQE